MTDELCSFVGKDSNVFYLITKVTVTFQLIFGDKLLLLPFVVCLLRWASSKVERRWVESVDALVQTIVMGYDFEHRNELKRAQLMLVLKWVESNKRAYLQRLRDNYYYLKYSRHVGARWNGRRKIPFNVIPFALRRRVGHFYYMYCF